VAGPAIIHQRIATFYGVGGDLLSADSMLLARLQQSAEFEAIRTRLARPSPVDSWQEDGFHYFVLELQPPGDGSSWTEEPPTAVFTMHPEAEEPIAAVVVTPIPGIGHAEVTDLREPDQTYSAPIPA
jgi:hypothetical protein